MLNVRQTQHIKTLFKMFIKDNNKLSISFLKIWVGVGQKLLGLQQRQPARQIKLFLRKLICFFVKIYTKTHKITVCFMFTQIVFALKKYRILSYTCTTWSFKKIKFKTKSDQNIHHDTLSCTFSSKFSWGSACPWITLVCVQL